MKELRRGQISGYIDHNYNGHKVRLHGDVIGINEGDMTAKMLFDNGVTSDGIPMEAIQLDEDVLTGIKKAANRAWGYIKGKFQKIGGMVRKMVGSIPIPFTRAVNIGQMAAANQLPDAVGFYPGAQAYAEAQEAGVKISAKDAPEEDRDLESADEFNKEWHEALKDLVKKENESHGSVSLQEIKSSYINTVKNVCGDKLAESLDKNPALDAFFGIRPTWDRLVEYVEYDAVNTIVGALNESANGVLNEDDLMSARAKENIPNVDMKHIVQLIMRQLKAAFEAGEFNFETEQGKEYLKDFKLQMAQDKYKELRGFGYDIAKAKKGAKEFAEKFATETSAKTKGTKSVMIWGAPGIGKTTIVQQVRHMFKNATKGEGTMGGTNGYNISMLEVVLSKMSADDFTLPTKGTDELTGEARSVNAVQSWIPCWQVTGNAKIDRQRNLAANLKMNKKEVLRNRPDVLQAMGVDADDLKDETRRDWEDAASDSISLENNQDAAKGKRIRNGVKSKNRKSALTQAIEDDQMKESWKIYEGVEDDEFTFDDFENDEVDSFEDINANELTDGGVIFFDELTRAPKAVMNVVMNLINDRKVGEGWVLGSHWQIVCAGNRFWEMTDIDSTWEKAFGTRFQNVNFVPTYRDWKMWAQGYNFDPTTGGYGKVRGPQRIDQEIIDFLDAAKATNGGDDSWYEDVKDGGDDGAKTYANPRSWQSASDAMVAAALEKSRRTGEPMYIKKNDAYYINLSHEEKLKILADNVGMGGQSYGKFKEFVLTSYFDDEMKENILHHGTLTGDETVNKEIETTGKYKSAYTIDAKDKSLKEMYVPKDPQTGRYVKIEGITIISLMNELLGKIDWLNVTNTELANVLAYFGVMIKMTGMGSLVKQWEDLYGSIFTRLCKTYYYDTNEEMRPEVREALKEAMGTDSENKEKYLKWMEPSSQVYCFMHGWDGIKDNLQKKSIAATLDSKKDPLEVQKKKLSELEADNKKKKEV